MSKRTIFILTCLASGAAASIVACGGSSGHQSASSIIGGLDHAECTAAFRCMSSYSGSDFSTRFGATEAACETMVGSTITVAEEAAIDASISAGRIKIDNTMLSSCENYYGSASCTTIFTAAAPTSCSTFGMGTVAIGGTCTTITETSGSGTMVTFDPGDCVTAAKCDATTHKCVASGFAPLTPSERLGTQLAD